MTRFLMPVVMLGIAVTIFLTFTNPIYSDISVLQGKVASYNDALDNSKQLENERDKLTAKYNAIDPDNLARLQKMLPDNVDNIRLILEIQKIASPYGMVLKNVSYNAADTTTPAAAPGIQAGNAKNSPKDYGIFNLGFTTAGNYDDFINFTKDLERNLRIVDISSISFSSNTQNTLGVKGSSVEAYTYSFQIKTYWLKN